MDVNARINTVKVDFQMCNQSQNSAGETNSQGIGFKNVGSSKQSSQRQLVNLKELRNQRKTSRSIQKIQTYLSSISDQEPEVFEDKKAKLDKI